MYVSISQVSVQLWIYEHICSTWVYVNDDTCVIVYRKFQLYWWMGVGICMYMYPSPYISMITSKCEFMKEYSPSNFKINQNDSSDYMHIYALLWCICVALIFNYIAFLSSSNGVCMCVCVYCFVICIVPWLNMFPTLHWPINTLNFELIFDLSWEFNKIHVSVLPQYFLQTLIAPTTTTTTKNRRISPLFKGLMGGSPRMFFVPWVYPDNPMKIHPCVFP